MNGSPSDNVKVGIKVRAIRIQRPILHATKVSIASSGEGKEKFEGAIASYIKQSLVSRCVLEGTEFSIILFARKFIFKIEAIEPKIAVEDESLLTGDPHRSPNVFLITDGTAMSFGDAGQATSQAAEAPDRFSSIGGLHSEIDKIRDMVDLPLTRPEVFSQYGLRPPRGVLLYGPPGTGKTLIASAIASSCGARMFVINGPELTSKYVGESEDRLRRVFSDARAQAPSIIFIDEIDSIATSRDAVESEQEKRVVGCLLTLMDGTHNSDRIVVLAATNRPDVLDIALRRPGRFDREIEIGIPKEADRLDILQKLFARMPHSLADDDLRQVASVTHGYVGADLAALAREAGLLTLTRSEGQGADADQRGLRVRPEDVRRALNLVRPSAMREVQVEVPKVRWEDIGGQADVKQKLKEAVEWPLTNPAAFVRMGIEPPKGILLYGPPGCSKTLMAKALASESSRNFIAIKGPELFSKWVGDSEKAIRQVFVH